MPDAPSGPLADHHGQRCPHCGAPLDAASARTARRAPPVLIVLTCLLGVAAVVLAGLLVADFSAESEESDAPLDAPSVRATASSSPPVATPNAPPSLVATAAPTSTVAKAPATPFVPAATTSTAPTGTRAYDHCRNAIAAAGRRQCALARTELALCSGALQPTAVANVAKYCR